MSKNNKNDKDPFYKNWQFWLFLALLVFFYLEFNGYTHYLGIGLDNDESEMSAKSAFTDTIDLNEVEIYEMFEL